MTARTQILAAVRAALVVPPVVPAVPDIERSLPEGVDAIELLIDRLHDYRAIVVERHGAIAEDIERALRTRGIEQAVVAPDLPSDLRPAGIACIEDAGFDARTLDGFAASITTAAVAVAQTGTIILTHGPGQGRRALSLVPDVHVCVLQRADVVGTLPEALARIGAPRLSTWISGPSATSDIELQRVEGVHGPRTLIVVLA